MNTYAKIRKDIVNQGLKVPVGETYYGGTESFLCRTPEDNEDVTEILFQGNWVRVESIDWEFSNEPGGEKTPLEIQLLLHEIGERQDLRKLVEEDAETFCQEHGIKQSQLRFLASVVAAERIKSKDLV